MGIAAKNQSEKMAPALDLEESRLVQSSVQAAGDKVQEPWQPTRRRKIWIDFENTPHVPFFLPIIELLRKQGYELLLTARDSYQVREMVRFHNVPCRLIGGHWGKYRVLKAAGAFWRTARLLPLIAAEKPDLAVAHGSRTQVLSCAILGVPSLSIIDYEFAASTPFLRTTWTFVPELIPSSRLNPKLGLMKYPGIKEDVYVPRFRPDSSLKRDLGLEGAGVVVTVRPPATEAHYHNPESEILLDAAMKLLIGRPDVRVVLVPRNKNQENALRNTWGEWITKGKMVIPKTVVDGLNLIWFSDLVISGGGTMNREAAALGVPVYSIFRGRIGAVDRYLSQTGRLQLLESVDDVQTKLNMKPREQGKRDIQEQSAALQAIVQGIVSITEHHRLPDGLP